MKLSRCLLPAVFLTAIAGLRADNGPYRLLSTVKVGGAGGFDYVFADSEARKLYIPRGDRVTIFDLDDLKPAGVIAETHSVHGVAIDHKSHHAFASSKPVVMWDSRTLQAIRTIDVEGSPDGIFFEPATERVYVLSHRAPNVTVIDGDSGNVVGTIDLGGAPEQGASDGRGRVFIDLENRDKVAVVDANSLKLLTTYDLQGKGGGPAGLALDAKNRVLFAFCRDPHTAVILNASSGEILATLPIGEGVDSAEFNPDTGEAFSSQRDGTLTVINETNPRTFEVEETVTTRPGARTSTLDAKTGRIFLITGEFAPMPRPPSPTGEKKGRGQRPQMVPGSFSILVVGR
jgi:DNA-binding beta-propeller fold protein YncE